MNDIAQLALATVTVNTLFHQLVQKHGRQHVVAAFSYVLGSNAAMSSNPRRVVDQAHRFMIDAMESLNAAKAKEENETAAQTADANQD